MDLTEEWRFLFPVSSVFAPPSLAPSHGHGPLVFSPLPPPTPLLSLPFPFPLPPPPLDSSTRRTVHSYLSSTSFLPFPALDSLAESLLAAPSPPFPPPSNLLAVLRARSSRSLILFFPYGENADQVAFAPLLDSSTPPVSLSVQSDGFKHPAHRIQQLAASPAQPSWPSSSTQRPLDEGFLLAATLYSVSWFGVQSQRPGSQPLLLPAAKQGFDAAVVHACWSKHLPSECAVLLENGELCSFDLDTRRGGKTRLGFGQDWGDWLSCEYGAQPWMVIIATTKAVLLVDLRSEDRGEYKVLARVGLQGLFETEPLVRTEHYVAFCKAGFDDFHISVVTERHLILLDARQPLTPVLAWQHGLETPNHVAMFRLSELRPSKEYEWASNSGFAILVGSLWNGEFSLFCYGPKEQGCPEKSHLYAWDLPSQFSLAGEHCSCSNAIMEEVFSKPVSGYGDFASQHGRNSVVGYYVLPNDLSMSEPTFDGFSLIRLTALGKLEIERYRASRNMHDDIPCHESQHMSRVSSSSILLDTQGENVSSRCRFLKLHFLSEHLEGNLCSALAKHDTSVNKHKKQIIISEDVSALAKGNSRSSSQSVSDFLCNASTPINVFEIACQSIFNSLPLDILNIAFSKYKDMLACSTGKHLEVPTFLPHNNVQPFVVTPLSTGEKLTSKVVSVNALVGPVLPVHVLLAMQERNKGIQTPFQGETTETNLVSHRCSEVLEAFVPEISIADTGNCNGWPSSQKLNDEKSYFVYEPQIENMFTLDETARKKKKEEHNDENFMTFVCGKAGIPDSGPEQATSDLFDFSPVRMNFDSTGIEIQPAEEKIYKCLKKQFLTWRNNFTPYKDFCSSYKIPKPPK